MLSLTTPFLIKFDAQRYRHSWVTIEKLLVQPLQEYVCIGFPCYIETLTIHDLKHGFLDYIYSPLMHMLGFHRIFDKELILSDAV